MKLMCCRRFWGVRAVHCDTGKQEETDLWTQPLILNVHTAKGPKSFVAINPHV